MSVKKINRLIILAVYDFEGKIDGYIEQLLMSNKEVCSRQIAVVNGNLSADSVKRMEKYADDVVIRDNKGYDAGAYKELICSPIWSEIIKKYDEVVLMNDTFYGPFWGWTDVFGTMQRLDVDFWGLSRHPGGELYNIDIPEHIQSYFMVFRSKIIQNNELYNFFENYSCENSYKDTIFNFEIGINQYLKLKGYKFESYLDVVMEREEAIEHKDPVFDCGGDIVSRCHFPILKRKFLNFQNIRQVNTALKCIECDSSYDMQLIVENIKRYIDNDKVFGFSMDKIKEFIQQHDNLYIYGHGKIGMRVADFLNYYGIESFRFVVTRKEKNEDALEIDNIAFSDTDGIIIAVGREKYDDVKNQLKGKAVKEENILSLNYT